MKPSDIHLGKLMMDAPLAKHTFQCVQFAYLPANNGICVASVAGPQTAVKSFAAALNENVRLNVKCDDFEVLYDDGERRKMRQFLMDFERIGGGQGKYKCHMHRLGYNQVHCTAVLKDPAFMPCLTDESLWRVLRSPRFTTPLLREWVPWLLRNLLDDAKLVKLPAFGCQPGMLLVDDKGLDDMVSRGIAMGALKIGKENACFTTSS